MEGLKQFPCPHCEKICKSKGGLTNHIQRMHANEGKANESGVKIPVLTSEAVDNMLADIRSKLHESQLYDENTLAEVDKLRPSSSFYEEAIKLFMDFGKNLSQDKLLEKFYGKMYSEWKTFFPSSMDTKYVFLVLIHLPEKLVNFYKQNTSVQENTQEFAQDLQARELGPLSYIAGYCIHTLYRKSKNSVHWNSERSQEIQALLVSLKDEKSEDEFVASISRGGLWAPNSTLVSIFKIAELVFRKHCVCESEKSLPADKMLADVLSSPEVKSLWESATTNCLHPVSEECLNLCLENILTLYICIRCFSHAKDIINKYKLKAKQQKGKGLRTELKRKEADNGQ